MDYGAGVTEGQVPYKDIYENKGPAWIFLFAFFQLLSPYASIGYASIIFLTILLTFYLSYKIARLFLSSNQSFATSFWVIILFRFARQNYAETEYFSIVPTLLCLYIIIKFIIQNSNHNSSNLEKISRTNIALFLTNGIGLSFCFWMKYQLIGIWVGTLLSLIAFSIMRKIRWTISLKIILLHFIGFMTPTALMFTYFSYHKALGDLISTYFFSRFSGKLGDTTGLISTQDTVSQLSQNFDFYLYFGELGIFAIICIFALFSRKLLNFYQRIFVLLSITIDLMLVISMFFIGELAGVSARNFIPIFIFSIIGFIYLIKIISPKLAHVTVSSKLLTCFAVSISIYLSGIPGSFQAQSVYLWQPEARLEQLPNSNIPYYKNGSYAYKVLGEYLRDNYSPVSENGHYFPVFAFGNYVSYYLKQPPLQKYYFCALVQSVCQKQYDETVSNILTHKYQFLVLDNTPIENNDIILDRTQLIKALVNRYSFLEIDSFLESHAHPIIAINQYNTVFALFQIDHN
jgi:hypothetical protein